MHCVEYCEALYTSEACWPRCSHGIDTMRCFFSDLSGNPFVCDCRLLWLRDWLETRDQQDTSGSRAPAVSCANYGDISLLHVSLDHCRITGILPVLMYIAIFLRLVQDYYNVRCVYAVCSKYN